MQLKLSIDGWTGDFEIVHRPNGSPKLIEIPGEFNETATVMASLSGLDSSCHYCLQLAYNPSHKFDCLRDYDGQLYYYNRKKKKKYKETQGQLLYGAMGPSVLRLMERNSEKVFWQGVVNVIPDADRLQVMRKMVSEIFPVNPYLAMSSAWGLSQISVSEKWKGELRSISIWSALIEYEATKLVFKKIAPHLQGMIASSASKIERHDAVVGVRSIRRISPQVVRRISRQVATMGELAIDSRVWASALSDSNDIVAHRVIGDFLRTRLIRLTKIQQEYRRFIGAGKKEIDDSLSGGDKTGYHKRAVQEENKTIKAIEKLKESIGTMYVSGPWNGLQAGLPILSLTADAFQYGSHYRYVYSQLSDFERMRYIWNSNENTQSHIRTLARELGNTGEKPNRWVRNYSEIYEGWVFVRLLRAFERFGFGMLKQYQAYVVRNAIDAYMGQRHNTQFELFSQDSDIKIELCYGCSFPPHSKECKGFCHMKKGTSDPLTPDFSIRISRIGTSGGSYALVLDAKSGRQLHSWDIKAREKYEMNVRKNANDSLDHVWLIYAGESHVEKKPTSGIEFSSLDGKECWACERWHDKAREESPVTKNGTFVWSRDGISQDGLMEKFSRQATFVGHLRANSVTAESSDVFDEFVEGIVKTARHVLGC